MLIKKVRHRLICVFRFEKKFFSITLMIIHYKHKKFQTLLIKLIICFERNRKIKDTENANPRSNYRKHSIYLLVFAREKEEEMDRDLLLEGDGGGIEG